MYKVDDVVVFRRNVCRVVGREISDMTGEDCYVLEPYHRVEGSMVMKVPVSNKAGHLRDVMSKNEIDALIENYNKVVRERRLKFENEEKLLENLHFKFTNKMQNLVIEILTTKQLLEDMELSMKNRKQLELHYQELRKAFILEFQKNNQLTISFLRGFMGSKNEIEK